MHHMHTALLTVENHQFTFLFGKYSVAEILDLIKKRNKNDKNKFYDKKQ